MIHGIYIRSKPKHKWHLFSITKSAVSANKELAAAILIAQQGGNKEGRAAIQVFDSEFFIPEMLTEIREQKSLGMN